MVYADYFGRARGMEKRRRYQMGIRRAADLGLITFGDTVGMRAEDPFAHHDDRVGWLWKPTNTRPLCRCAAEMLRSLRDRSPLHILELGPGAGFAAAEIRGILCDCTLTTIGLTPINPFQNPTAGSAICQPFIDRQFIGDLERMLPAAGGPFDFIYDNYGPIFWILHESARWDSASRAGKLVSDILKTLHGDGVLFVGASEGTLLLERLLDRYVGPDEAQIRSVPIYSRTEIRTCVVARGDSRPLLEVGRETCGRWSLAQKGAGI